MTVIPTRSIGEITATLVDYRGKTPPKSTGGIKLITAKIIKGGFIIDGEHEYISEETYSKWMRRGFPCRGDIVITTEAPLGEVAVLKTEEKVALAQRVILLRGKPEVICQSYYFYALQSPFVQAGLKARSTGTTVSGIKQRELRQVQVPCPPLPVQRKIADVLSAYDDLIENNTRRIRILEEMAQAIYREWFVNFRFPGHEEARIVDSELGPIPEGWEVTRFSDAVQIDPQTLAARDSEKAYVPMSGLSPNCMVISEYEIRTGNSGSKFRNGDTLFARITPSLEHGKTGFVQFLSSDEGIGNGSTEFIVFRSRTLNAYYVYFLARDEGLRQHAIQSMVGASGRQRVQKQCFDSFYFARPDGQTLSHFAELVSPMFREVQALWGKNEVLRQTRDLLLPRLIAGEFDVSRLNIHTECLAQ